MSKNFNLKSIRLRVLLYFLGFTAILLFLIWFLQIFFLNHYYEDMKIRLATSTATQISSYYNTGNLDLFTDKADAETQDSDVYIQLNEGDQVVYPQTESLSYRTEVSQAHRGLTNALLEGETKYTSIYNSSSDKRTFVYATTLGDNDDYILVVISPLYPVGSTVSILKNQFSYVTFIALLLALILSYYLSARITKPIRSLTKTVRSMSTVQQKQQQMVFPIMDKGYAEIAELSTSLNRMSIELGKTQALQQDLMANVSHDLRTPLTMIKSYAELIRDISGENPVKRDAHLQVIIDETDRLTNLVGDIMELSQMQAGTVEVKPGIFDIREAAESIVSPYRVLEEKEHFRIEVRCQRSCQVIGDEDKIKRVLSNLLTNAIKFRGEDGRVILNIRQWRERVHVEVIDHGAGISPEELSHIWERYYKASSNHVRSATGSGLGLSIVSEILTLHKARFGAESKVGRGTTFWFELPIYIPVTPKNPRVRGLRVPEGSKATKQASLLSHKAEKAPTENKVRSKKPKRTGGRERVSTQEVLHPRSISEEKTTSSEHSPTDGPCA